MAPLLCVLRYVYRVHRVEVAYLSHVGFVSIVNLRLLVTKPLVV